MSLTRVWPNGVASMPVSAKGTPQLNSADLAAIDQNEQQALDKYVGGTVFGTVTLGAGGKISLDGSASFLTLGGTSTTSSGGRWQCGHGDFPSGLFLTLTMTNYFGVDEMFQNSITYAPGAQVPFPAHATPLNWEWYIQPSSGFGQPYSGTIASTIPYGAAFVPITRAPDGGILTSVSVPFLVSSARTILPSDGNYPGVAIFQYDPFLNILTNLNATPTLDGFTYVSTPANLAHYYSPTGSGNSPQTITVTMPASYTVNVGKYCYFVVILDESYASETSLSSTVKANLWPGILLNYTKADLAFQ